MTAEDRLMEWLRDAHATAVEGEGLLTRLADRADAYPDLKARVQYHAAETRRQARYVAHCIERRGGSVSGLKDLKGKAVALVNALCGTLSGEIVKDAIRASTFEGMEIASYRALIAAAEEVGDAETRDVCERILVEQEAMAEWLRRQLPTLTAQSLSMEQTTGLSATL